MPEFPDTRESLILRVKDPSNRRAWDEFADLYRPVIFRIAVARGMQHADAQDLSQLVLLAVSSAVSRWEKRPDGTPFRNWLSRVTKNAILKALSRGPRDRAMGGSDLLPLLEDLESPDDAAERLITLEYRRELYLRAVAVVRDQVQNETWQVFELTVLDGLTVEETVARTGIAKGCVYAGRSRVMRRLKDAVRRLEEQS